MKKRIKSAILAIVITAAIGLAAAAASNAGSASNPLISLSYLNNTLKNEILNTAETSAANALNPIYDNAVSQIDNIENTIKEVFNIVYFWSKSSICANGSQCVVNIMESEWRNIYTYFK